MARYIDEGDIYELFQPTGIARIHVAQIDELPRADVVPKSEVAWEMFNEIHEALHDRIMAHHVIMSTRYAPDEKLHCDECVFIRDHILKPIEKKYTEGNDE